MNEFERFHPIVNLMYFLSVIGFSMFFMHPIMLAVSLLTGGIYSLMLNGKRAFKFNFIYILPIVLFMAAINPLFNHQGETILAYFPGGSPLTLEAIIYGCASAVMLWSVICHFSCFNTIMTSDKIMYVFGKIFPASSLVFSMVLRFIPKFKNQMYEVIVAQRAIGTGNSAKVTDKMRNGVRVLSVMLTWSFENAIETADSMKSRGYGLNNRTSYSNYTVRKKDVYAIAFISILCGYIVLAALFGVLSFEYYPRITDGAASLYENSVYVAYIILFSFPIIIELWEAVKWKKLKSKI